MDPLGTSCENLHLTEISLNPNGPHDEGIRELVASYRSLSKYESRTWKSLTPQIIASLIVGSINIANGVSMAYSAILIPQLEEPNSEIKPTATENSWMASVLILVAPVCSVICGIIMDNIGRMNTLKVSAIPGIIGWCLIAVSKNVTMIIFGRIFVGISVVLGPNAAFIYITEIATPTLRMSLMALGPCYFSLGMMLSYLGGWILHWRTIAWFTNILVIFPCILCIFLHESPSWLILKGRYEAAQKSLDWLHKYQPKPTEKGETFAELQFRLIHEEQEKKKEEMEKKGHKGVKAVIKELLKPTGYKPVLILFGLFVCQQFSGPYIILFYSISFIKETGSDINGYLASIFIGVVRLIMSIVIIYVLKTFRRRTLMFASSFSMAVCMFVAGLYTMWIKEGTTTLTWVPVVAIVIYIIVSTIGLIPIPLMLQSELFPLEIRGIGFSISQSIAFLCMFASLQSYFPLSVLFGGAANLQWFFSTVCLTCVVYCYVFLPETIGLKLSDISDYFKDHSVYIGHTQESYNEKKYKRNVNKVNV